MLFGFVFMLATIAVLGSALKHCGEELRETRTELQLLQMERALDRALGPRPPLKSKAKNTDGTSVAQGGES